MVGKNISVEATDELGLQNIFPYCKKIRRKLDMAEEMQVLDSRVRRYLKSPAGQGKRMEHLPQIQ